jgi:hypothetical protein
MGSQSTGKNMVSPKLLTVHLTSAKIFLLSTMEICSRQFFSNLVRLRITMSQKLLDLPLSLIYLSTITLAQVYLKANFNLRLNRTSSQFKKEANRLSKFTRIFQWERNRTFLPWPQDVLSLCSLLKKSSRKH